MNEQTKPRKGRRKTSKAIHRSARLNPIHPEEAKVIEIIEHWESQNFNFKQLIVDRILRGEGHTPELFAKETSIAGADHFATIVEEIIQGEMDSMKNSISSVIENMLTDFAEQLMSKMKQMGWRKTGKGSGDDDNEDEDGETSKLAKNFARGYMERQRAINGQSDYEDDE